MMEMINKELVIADTERWIRDVVIGLNLCPFARKVFEERKIRYVVSEATEDAVLLMELVKEFDTLKKKTSQEVETTFLIHPNVLRDFIDYNEFLDGADRLIQQLGWEGIFQIASFHPDYQFADTKKKDIENYTNRSPFPMLHLLREESISRLTVNEAELLEIPKRNIETLRKLGEKKVMELWHARRN